MRDCAARSSKFTVQSRKYAHSATDQPHIGAALTHNRLPAAAESSADGGRLGGGDRGHREVKAIESERERLPLPSFLAQVLRIARTRVGGIGPADRGRNGPPAARMGVARE